MELHHFTFQIYFLVNPEWENDDLHDLSYLEKYHPFGI
jgi:hypothetical protein